MSSSSSSSLVASYVRKLQIRLVGSRTDATNGYFLHESDAQLYAFLLKLLYARSRTHSGPTGAYGVTGIAALGEQEIISTVQRQVARLSGAEEGVRFAELCRRLRSCRVVKERANVLAALYLISRGSNDSGAVSSYGGFGMEIGNTSDGMRSGGLDPSSMSQISSSKFSETVGFQHMAVAKREQETPGKVQTAMPQLISVDSLPLDILRHDEEDRGRLASDLVFILQGISGRYLRFSGDEEDVPVRFSSEIELSSSAKRMMLRLGELGWLYTRVSRFIKAKTDGSAMGTTGLMMQSFVSTLRAFLADYHRSLAVLETQIRESISNREPYSIRRLVCWAREPMQMMEWLALLVDVCGQAHGGEIASILYKYRDHGDAGISALVDRVLNEVSIPLLSMIYRWVFEGALDDPFDEFFVGSHSNIPLDRLWYRKYEFRDSMRPAFIKRELADRIFSAGKSINFIRLCMKDSEWIIPTTAANDGRRALAEGNWQAVESVVERAYSITNEHLLHGLYHRFSLRLHLGALKRYLLLGQGDFIQYLMETIGGELDKPASQIVRHALPAILETAIRGSNAQYDDPEILERLDVRLFQESPGDDGWAVFSLDYHVDTPLNVLFTPPALEKYLRVFKYLWQLKRSENALSKLWCRQMSMNHYFQPKRDSDLARIVHLGRGLAHQMMHFSANFGYFVMFEVLECSWDALLREIEDAKDLASLISAHSRYLDDIVEKLLLGESDSSLRIREVVVKITETILEFCSIQERHLQRIDEELESRRHEDEVAISEVGWSRHSGKPPVDLSSSVRSSRSDGFHDLTVKVGRRISHVGNVFRELVSNLLDMVAHEPAQDDILKYLSFRLDFNEFYAEHGQ